MFNLKQMVLDATTYVSGYVNEDDRYVISASMLGNTPLQNYLSIVHGKITNADIDDSTLGSVFHAGMETISKEKQRADILATGESDIKFIEHSMDMELPNGWILSGTGDLVTSSEPHRFAIHDHKLSKFYASTMLKKEITTHGYTKQLRALDLLFRRTSGEQIDGNIDLFVQFFAKEAKAIDFEPSHMEILIPSKTGTEEMSASEITIAEIVEQTNSLQAYIESGEIPEQCKDLWWRVSKGKRIPTKCVLYCSHGKEGLCPHYVPSTRTAVERISGW